MVKKQPTPRQLHLLQEVKRKAQADREARLTRLTQQEALLKTSAHRTRSSITPKQTHFKYHVVRRGRTCNVIYTTWAECKAQAHQFPGADYKSFPTYIETQNHLSIGANRRTNRTSIGSSSQKVIHQSHISIQILNQTLQILRKLNQNKSWQ